MKDNPTLNTLVKLVMWIVWLSIVMSCVIFNIFLVSDDTSVNSFSRSIGGFEIGFIVLPFLFCMAYRFLLIPRVSNIFILMPMYFVGLFLAEHIVFYGIFLIKEYLIVFNILCGMATLSYMPCFIKMKWSIQVTESLPTRPAK